MTEILCIGSVLWDIIGRSPASRGLGTDVPGRITRLPGGVAMNIAMTLRRFGLSPVLLSAVGTDSEGNDLMAAAEALGLNTEYLFRSDLLPTDRYMAIEGPTGLMAAIADAHSLEAAGDRILAPLRDGRLGSEESPYAGPIALDGNLTEAQLAAIAHGPLFGAAHLLVAPASPGKAERLQPFLDCPNARLYVNIEEAGLLAKDKFATSDEAARALIARGAADVLVTDGARTATHATRDTLLTAEPPEVMVSRVTGAGDTFMAGHIAAELRGESHEAALATALRAAAEHISGDIPS